MTFDQTIVPPSPFYPGVTSYGGASAAAPSIVARKRTRLLDQPWQDVPPAQAQPPKRRVVPEVAKTGQQRVLDSIGSHCSFRFGHAGQRHGAPHPRVYQGTCASSNGACGTKAGQHKRLPNAAVNRGSCRIQIPWSASLVRRRRRSDEFDELVCP